MDIEQRLAGLEAQLRAQQERINDLEVRARETDIVDATVIAWTQYAVGSLLLHLDDPEHHPSDEVAQNIEAVFSGTFGTLKQGFRGRREPTAEMGGFDFLYVFAQGIQGIWESMRKRNFEHTDDRNGYKLRNAAKDMLARLDPQVLAVMPLEAASENAARKQAGSVVQQARQARGPDKP